MIYASTVFKDYLATRKTLFMADLVTITPRWGMGALPAPQSLYYTNAGRIIETGMEGGPGPWLPFPLERVTTKVTRGIEVGECDLVCYPRPHNRIATFEIQAPGAGYAFGNILALVQAGAVGGELMVTTVGEAGEVLEATLRRPGHNYQVAAALATTAIPAGGEGCTVNLLTLCEDFINGVPWLTAAGVNGQLQGAGVRVQRALFDTITDASPIGSWPEGVITRFLGKVADADYSPSRSNLKVKSFTEILNRDWPRNLYQAACLLDIYSDDCGASLETFTSPGALTGGTTTLLEIDDPASFPQDTGYFDGGVITFTTGPNAGAWRTIKTFTAGRSGPPGPSVYPTVEITLPLLHTPGADEISMYPTCNYDYATDCSTAKFNRQAYFRATPNIPPIETVA